MLSDIIYEHFREFSQAKIDPLLGSATLIEKTFTVSRVINEITKNGVYDVFCLDDNSVLTTNVRSLLTGKDISQMKVKSFLNPIPCLSPGDSVQKAANLVNNYRVRAVPVVDKKGIKGVISAKTILELLSSKDNKWIKANLICTQNPVTISSNEPLSTARKLMVSKKIDHLPVVNKDSVRQVLTSFHVLHAINPHESLGRKAIGERKIRNLESNVGNIGSTRIPKCSSYDNLNTIVGAMLEADTTCCLVFHLEKLHGIITYRDILSLLAIKMESEIPLYIVGMPEDQINSDIIKSKFIKTLNRVSKVYSEIQEARVTIKRQRTSGKRQYYQVSARITTPHRIFIHKEVGWDLSQVIEILSQRLLRRLAKRAKRRFKTSIRKRGFSSLIEPI